MTQKDLAKSYLEKAIVRFEVLTFLYKKRAYSDVVREAQELVELATKAMLRERGIDPPKHHDVSPLFYEHRELFPELSEKEIKKIMQISKWLRKERELSFYGDIDFIPTERYTSKDAKKAIEGAKFVLELAKKIVKCFD